MIEDLDSSEDTVARARPWWFIPALLGVGLGGLLGLGSLLLPQGVPTTTALISSRPSPSASALLAAPLPSVQVRSGQPAATTPARWTRTLVPFAQVLRPARVYVFQSALVDERGIISTRSDSTASSRFVLYDDGTFALHQAWQLAGEPPSEERGKYTEANGVITFDRWEPSWSVSGPFVATGSLEGNLLSVRYNMAMRGSDHEDAVYLRTQ